MRQMMRQLSSSGMFGGGGLKGKMMRRMAGVSDIGGTRRQRGRPAYHCRRRHREKKLRRNEKNANGKNK